VIGQAEDLLDRVQALHEQGLDLHAKGSRELDRTPQRGFGVAK